ncbi:kinase-like domain-containing protein [Phellopilus nigrolimitatus]|nr:kinase-like domain-containing protein [Phellopilus nigrolimitatus]
MYPSEPAYLHSDKFHDLLLLKEAVKCGKSLVPPSDIPAPSQVLEIDDRRLVVKFGPLTWKSEALAMQLVYDRTSVPVPRVRSYLSETVKNQHCGYIVMEKVSGTPLAKVISELSDETCDYITKQLAAYLLELQKLDTGEWGNVGRKNHFHRGYFVLKPGACRVNTIKDFLDYFINQGAWRSNDTRLEGCLKAIDQSRPSMFSHGDLNPENIMINATSGKITGIIDWELAGWYPYFWNFWIARRWGFRAAEGPKEKWRRIYSKLMGPHIKAAESFGILQDRTEFHGMEETPFIAKYVPFLSS